MTIIVDDEWLIRSELKLLLTQYPKICVVGEAGNIAEAIQLINELKPDVLFLDTQMKDDDGFEALRNTNRSFKTILLSVFDEKIATNNNINVIDFLMKPINKTKLHNIIAKL